MERPGWPAGPSLRPGLGWLSAGQRRRQEPQRQRRHLSASVSRASVEDLVKVEGLSQALAERIFGFFRKG